MHEPAPWYDPTHWSATAWTAVGVILTLLLAVLGWLGQRAARSRSIRPLLTIAPLQFLGHGQDARPAYPFAIGFRVANVGNGPALKIVFSLLDMAWETEEQMQNAPVFPEVYTQDVLIPGDSIENALGLRGPDQDDDPTEEQAFKFFNECLANAVCWDARGRPYIFFPFGGGPTKLSFFRSPLARLRFGKWPPPEELWSYLHQHPSREAQPTALGVGRTSDKREKWRIRKDKHRDDA